MFPRLRTDSTLPADQQSVVPNVRGLPWWGAVILATVVTAIGAIIDADTGSGLGRTFKVCYILGCVLAALAVRRRALFTTAVQPPLIAFVVGIATLYTINGRDAEGMKTIILKVVLPIAYSFPWILFTFLITLLVVLGRLFCTGPESARPFGGIGRFTKNGVSSRPKQSTGTRPKSAGTRGGARPARTPADRTADRQTARKAGTTGKSRSRTDSTADRGDRPRAADAKKAAAHKRRPAKARTERDTPTRTLSKKATGSTTAAAKEQAARAAAPGKPATRKTPTADAPPRERPARPTRDAPQQPRNQTPQDGTRRPDKPRRPAPSEEGRRRAQPQKIAARPRPTAGQQLRNRGGQIEDLTAGIDD
ncbi:DUF6542 domain-containing protein [Gordonia zhaorongruii]|uniref:DUF6542 domain-containing protein n=1 Tax=Gordonia zhaorongruii TaxID=2597659 RepID=UPI00117F1CE4|nr:DUF6542 domain-containing protein [Gordonia zhaorongruii]